jgi:glycosyltransferase involved in cell wall biosynthesis
MSQPIRVLELINGYAVEGPLGGAERFVIEMSTRLDQSLVQPQVFGLWDWQSPHQQRWRQLLLDVNIPAYEGPQKDESAPYRNFMDALRLIPRMVQGPIDIIHSHSEFGDVAALLLKGTLGAKAVMRTVHNEIEWPKRPERRLLLSNVLYPLFYHVELTVSKQAAQNLARRPLARLLGKRATVAYNALNFDRFAQRSEDEEIWLQSTRQKLGIPLYAPVVGSVGRLAPQKGFTYLLTAARAVLAQRPEIHFIIAGSGHLQDELREQAIRLGIDSQIHFLGAQPDIEKIFRLMNLFVSSSLWEGLPTTILEALAAGIPVVATQVSGTVEMVEHEQTGLLVAPGDPLGLAEAILHALAKPELMKEMAARGRDSVHRRFDIQTVAEQHLSLYTRLAKGEPI